MTAMFDWYLIAPPSVVNVNKTVKEYRAPTDDSVKLLREMESKAREQVIKAVAVVDNKFNCNIQVLQDNLSARILIRVIFDLNGERLTVEHAVYPVRSFSYDQEEEILQACIKAISDATAKHLLKCSIASGCLSVLK